MTYSVHETPVQRVGGSGKGPSDTVKSRVTVEPGGPVQTKVKTGSHVTPEPGVIVPVLASIALGVNAAISRVAAETEPPDEFTSAVGGNAFELREEHPVLPSMMIAANTPAPRLKMRSAA
jgi:hypothetical protein